MFQPLIFRGVVQDMCMSFVQDAGYCGKGSMCWFRSFPRLDLATFGEPKGRFLWAERTQGTTSRPVDTLMASIPNKIDATGGFHGKSPGFLGVQNLYFFMGFGGENGI